MKRFVLPASIIVVSLFLCVGTIAADEVEIFASNYPLAYFAVRISGRPEIVKFPGIKGDPAFWEPTAGDILVLQRATLVLLNGATYEKWRGKVELRESRVIDTSAKFSDYLIQMPPAEAGTGTAVTTWIDLQQALLQAGAVKDGLIKANVAPKGQLESNFEALKGELTALDSQIAGFTQQHADRMFITSQPAYGYFARRYNVNLQSVAWEPAVFPDEDMWKELEKLLEQHPATWMIWRSEPLSKSVERLKEMGIQSLVFDPCANKPATGDFMSVMRQNAENLRRAFE